MDLEGDWVAKVLFFRCYSPTLLADVLSVPNELLIFIEVCSTFDDATKMLFMTYMRFFKKRHNFFHLLFRKF